MNSYYYKLKEVNLFKGINLAGLDAILKCLEAEILDVNKGKILILAGDKPQYVGVVISGRLHIIREDYDGNRNIISAVTPFGIFAEALCCAGVSESPVTVIADADSSVLRLKFSRILHTCPNACNFHTKLIENMLQLIANKNLLLQSRMEILSLKPIRARVMRYFETFAPKHGKEFIIPFNREELANFICVERSALSHELAKMKKEGLIDYKKNKFIIY